ncbi:MAG: metal-dependent hydrolase [Kiritimatiellia bacterium]|jgi:hypothetical protein
MTHVGHSLTGVALGMLCLPKDATPGRMFLQLFVFFNLANLPDWQFNGWGHSNYNVSHSLFVNLALMLCVFLPLAYAPGLRARLGGWPVLICGGLAWLSHLLLDSFYEHGQGIAILWPLSDWRLSLPVPWFSILHGSRFSTEHLVRVYTTEFVCFFPFVLAAWFYKHKERKVCNASAN